MTPQLGTDCWRIERAEKASVIIDADNYFRLARDAMMKAKRRIMLIGWDFDPAISLIREDEAKDGAPVVIGDFITWLVERTPELEIFLLRWDVGAIKSMARPSHLVTTLRWMAHPRITVKLDGHHPPRRVASSENRGDRRLFRFLRWHRHDRRPVGHAPSPRRGTGAAPPRRIALWPLA